MTLLLAVIATIFLGTIVGARLDFPSGSFGDVDWAAIPRHLTWLAAAGAFYAAGVWLVRYRRLGRAAIVIILGAGLAARIVLLVMPPIFSTDLYRYVWDGRVQAAGINPYRYIPADPALVPLRDPGTGPEAIYDNMNRRDEARTIYPPAAQLLFALVGQVASSIWGIKAAMLLLDLATAGMLLRALQVAGRPLAHVLVWAWNPLVIMEFAGAGHIDALACAFTALALLLAIQARRGWAGMAFGVAIAAKFLPAALFPAIWRRWDIRGPAAALAVVLAGYAIYASAGTHVLGFLGGYAKEENLDTGSGFSLLRLVGRAVPLPPWAGIAYIGLAIAILAGIAVWTIRRPLPGTPAARAIVIGRGAAILATLLMALISPHYPWYLTLLAVPATLMPAWGAIWPTIAAPLLYLPVNPETTDYTAVIFLPSLLLLLPDLLYRSPSRPPSDRQSMPAGI